MNSVLDGLSDMCQFCHLNIHCFVMDFLLHFCILFQVPGNEGEKLQQRFVSVFKEYVFLVKLCIFIYTFEIQEEYNKKFAEYLAGPRFEKSQKNQYLAGPQLKNVKKPSSWPDPGNKFFCRFVGFLKAFLGYFFTINKITKLLGSWQDRIKKSQNSYQLAIPRLPNHKKVISLPDPG